MDLQFVKVTQPLDLGDYLGEGPNAYRGKLLFVWVNPDESVRAERAALLRDYERLLPGAVSTATDPPRRFPFLPWRRRSGTSSALTMDATLRLQERTFAWLATILNQDDRSACDAATLKSLWAADPVLYDWVLRRSVDMIAAYKEEKKRISRAPSMTSSATV